MAARVAAIGLALGFLGLCCFGGGKDAAENGGSSSAGGAGGVAGAPGPRSCLSIEAGANLNLFDGQPHVVVLYFFPLQNVTAFQAADLRDLVNGVKPAGLAGETWEATVLPGQKLDLKEPLPRETQSVGVLADFYRGPRKAVVSVACSGEKIVLSASDLQVVKAGGEE